MVVFVFSVFLLFSFKEESFLQPKTEVTLVLGLSSIKIQLIMFSREAVALPSSEVLLTLYS